MGVNRNGSQILNNLYLFAFKKNPDPLPLWISTLKLCWHFTISSLPLFISFPTSSFFFASDSYFVFTFYLSSTGSSFFQNGGRFLAGTKFLFFYHFRNTANILIFYIQISSVLSILFAFLFITFNSRTMIKIFYLHRIWSL